MKDKYYLGRLCVKSEPFDNDFEDDDVIYLPPLVVEDLTLIPEKKKLEKSSVQREIDDILKDYLND